ncbi:MAG: molybdopterin cofactor-binding domain-containing protein [Nocardioidaceae bacterium]
MAPSRRTFLGYLVSASTVVAAAEVGLGSPASAEIPSGPQPPELYDLNDLLTDATLPTANLITITVHEDGTASFELPRSENGQGITTSTAMLIAEELEIPVERVVVTLADARPELVYNQLTGGSNTTISTYTPVRVAAAIAKGALLRAAAIQLGSVVERLHAKAGVIEAPDGSSVTYGELASAAAAKHTHKVEVTLKPDEDFTVIGTEQNRLDALDAVTGRKTFTMDLDIPDALPAMICRAPTLNGTPRSVRNRSEVESMPGVTDVAVVPTGVAVRARTFGQCIDAIRALRVRWDPGTVAGQSDRSILRELKRAELPLLVPDVGPLTDTVDASFTFHFRSNSALETNCAVADVRADSAEIWSGLKAPITAKQEIALALGMLPTAVTVHVMQGGGSFGRKLFHDGALEAAQVSQATGKPVRLMWHRTDDSRVGRTHPMATSRIRATCALGNVLTFEQRHTSIKTDFGHGVGEVITALAAKLPVGDIGFSQTIFALTQEVPYNFGAVDQLLNEVDGSFNTGSMRNIYSPDVCTARELMVDKIARKLRRDPYEFRREFIKTDRHGAALDKVAELGDWGRSMPAGTAQGIAVHKEYKGVNAVLVEIDCRPETVNRPIRDGVTGPRVTKVVMAVDVGLAINPQGLKAQMQGGIMDGIALALTSSLHLRDGYFLEGSWDDYFYTRQWNVPPEVEVVVMPSDSGQPGGAGEFGVASTFAAVACAYARATGRMPTDFPINHHDPLAFEPKPTVPPIPPSPTDGLEHTY